MPQRISRYLSLYKTSILATGSMYITGSMDVVVIKTNR